jgi:hypothetical protein
LEVLFEWRLPQGFQTAHFGPEPGDKQDDKYRANTSSDHGPHRAEKLGHQT